MSILIPGMKMPPKGKYLQLRIDSDGTIDGEYTEDKYICTNFVERKEKAIELPPHGDLIDRSKIAYTRDDSGLRSMDFARRAQLENVIHVIPAEVDV